MAETPKVKRSSLGKKLGIVFGIFLLLLVVFYFVVTSTAFFKGVILPRVSKAAGADVTVADASISPFSRIELKGLKVQKAAEEPLLQADQLVARYSLRDIMGGTITVHEATLVNPVIKIVEDAEGNKNTETTQQDSGQKPEPSKDEETKLNISNVTLKNGTVQAIKKHKNGTQELTELANLNLTIDRLRNAASSKITLSSEVRLQSPGTNGSPNLLTGTLNGDFAVVLAQALALDSANGKAQFTTRDASGDYSDLRGLNAGLNVDVTPTAVKALALQFTRSGKSLGEIRASGPFDLSKQEGKLNVEIASIDQNVLNLVGASKGMDFGSTKINSTNEIAISKAGELVAIQGQLTADSFSVTQTNQTTPPVNLVAKYNVTVDQPAKTASISTFDVDATQKGQLLLSGNLSKPMKLNWGSSEGAVDESALSLVVTNLNLADWKAFAPELNPAGRANLNLKVLSKGAGKQLQFEVSSKLSDFSAQSGSNKIDQADISLATRGQLVEFDNLTLQDSRIELAQDGQAAALLTASGTYGVKSGNADLKATMEAALPKLVQLVKMQEVDARSGTLTFNGQVKQNGKDQTILGNFSLKDFTGKYGESKFENYSVISDADITKSGDQLSIRKMLIALTQAGRKGGTMDVSGKLNTASSVGSFDVKLNGLNETGVRPFVAASLGERKLNSVLVNGAVTAKLNGTNNQAVVAALDVANLVIVEPAQTNPPVPLAIKLNADVAAQGDNSDLRSVTATINYGGKPAGSFDLKGKINTVTKIGQIDMNLTGINENAVRPFMPKVGGKDLVSVAINGSASANLNSTNNSAVKADFKISDLVVKDPKQPKADAPLSVQVQVDSTVEKQVYDLRQLKVTLSPTARAKNELSIRGRLDLSNTNAYNGDIVITSDSLDVTSFYNLYTGTEAPEAAKAGSTPPVAGNQGATGPVAVTDPNKESEPMNLPKGQMVLTMNIAQLFLRDIAITNLQANGRVATNRVTLSPMQMTMNGGSMKADVDVNVGVPGYNYSVSFLADRVPLQPVANTFLPEERDQYQGFILADGKIKGTGTTGVNLKKHLSGDMGFTFTNANIKSKKIQPTLNLIATVLSVPEVAESPISWMDAKMQFVGGEIRIPRLIMESEAIRSTMQTVIPIANVLSNSPVNMQVPVELRKALARKLPKEIYVEESSHTNYMRLPQFLIVKGPLGDPKPEADEKGLMKAAAIGVAREVFKDKVGGDAGRLIDSFLGGGKPVPAPAPTNAPTQPVPPPTQAVPPPPQQPRPPATNQPPAKAPTQPNVQTNTPADTVNQIIDLFNRPKKK